MDLSIRGRLLVLTGLAVAGVAIVAALFFSSNQLNQRALAAVYEQDGKTLVRLQRMENTLLEVRFRAAGVLLEQLPVPGSLNHLKEARQAVQKLWGEFGGSAQLMFTQGDALAQLRQVQDRWSLVDATLANLEKAYSAKDNKAITGVLEDEWPVMVKGVIKPLQTLIPMALSRSEETYQRALTDSRNMLTWGYMGPRCV